MSTPDSGVPSPLRVLFRRLALAAAALTFVVIVASAFMRHTQAGLSCADWPACYGRIATATASASDSPQAKADADVATAPTAGVRAARIAHRIAATGVLALVIGLLLVAWTQKPAWKREGRLAAAALVTAGALAVLGVATPGAQLPAVTLGNLLGGYLMLALLAATWASAGSSRAGAPARRTRADPLVVAGLALLFVQTALGGTIGAQYALTACPTLGSCLALPFDPFVASAGLDPFRPLAAGAGRIIAPADATVIHVMHRALAIVVTFLALVVAYLMHRTVARAARLLAAAAILAPLTGAAAIMAMPSLPFTVLHNATAAVMVAMFAAILARR